MRILSALVFLAALDPANAFELRGSIKSYAIHQEANNLGSDIDSLDGRLRLTAKVNPTAFSGELAYEIVPLLRKNIPPQPTVLLRPRPASYRCIDLNPEVFTDDDEFFLFHNLDRALVSLSPSFAEIHIGRQAVAFGVSRVIVPTDIITLYTFNSLDQEYRIGVDAVRALIPLGELTELEVGYIAGNDFLWQQSALYARGHRNLAGSDIELVLIQFRENTLLGASVESSISDAGVWLEAAYTWTRSFEPLIMANDYFRLSTGADYKLTDDLYVFGEYHYSSAGTTRRGQVPQNIQQVAYTQGAVYLLGEHYLTPGIAWDATPLTKLNVELLTNLVDISAYLSTKLEYSLKQNLILEGGLLLPMNTGMDNLGISSEFGYYPTVVYLDLRHYF